jgi:hypothetical protein
MSKKRIDRVMENALIKRKLEIYSMELDRWNFGSMVDGVWVDDQKPKADGTYDKMGLDSSDVCAYWKTYWWKPHMWKDFISSFGPYFSNIKEFVIEGFFTNLIKRPKYLLRLIKNWVIEDSPFAIDRSGWVWVCDSRTRVIQSHAYEMAQKMVAVEKGYKDYYDYFEKTGHLYDSEAEKEKIDSLAKKLIGANPNLVFEDFLDEHDYRPAAPYLWLNKADITCFVIDEKVAPFDMRDGWSSAGLCKPIAAWVKVAYGIDIDVVYKAEKKEDDHD